MSTLFYDAGPAATGQKVCLATTVYENADASYTFSIQKSREALTRAGIQSAYMLLSGNCHVDDARNAVVRDFLETDCTDLVFLDADVSWNPEQLIELLSFDADVVGGVYPYRREGSEDMPVQMLPHVTQPLANGLLEVAGLPTGFMRIKRHVLERLSEQAVNYTNKRGEVTKLIFERTIEGARRCGGDIGFCHKWRALGGQVYAAAELRLGHVAKSILYDSLSASLRRKAGSTLRYVCQRIAEGSEQPDDYREVFKYIGNVWGAQEDFLSVTVYLARKADGPIIEAGSGLTTILMAAANPAHIVYCIEHSPIYALKTEAMAREAGVQNIAIVTAPIVNGWYSISDEDLAALPGHFALGLCDGPPRALGGRKPFFEVFGDRCTVFLADDADDADFLKDLTAWAEAHGRTVHPDFRTVVILPKGEKDAETKEGPHADAGAPITRPKEVSA